MAETELSRKVQSERSQTELAMRGEDRENKEDQPSRRGAPGQENGEVKMSELYRGQRS